MEINHEARTWCSGFYLAVLLNPQPRRRTYSFPLPALHQNCLAEMAMLPVVGRARSLLINVHKYDEKG